MREVYEEAPRKVGDEGVKGEDAVSFSDEAARRVRQTERRKGDHAKGDHATAAVKGGVAEKGGGLAASTRNPLARRGGERGGVEGWLTASSIVDVQRILAEEAGRSAAEVLDEVVGKGGEKARAAMVVREAVGGTAVTAGELAEKLNEALWGPAKKGSGLPSLMEWGMPLPLNVCEALRRVRRKTGGKLDFRVWLASHARKLGAELGRADVDLAVGGMLTGSQLEKLLEALSIERGEVDVRRHVSPATERDTRLLTRRMGGLGTSLRKLAGELKVPFNTLRRFLRGEASLPEEDAHRILSALKLGNVRLKVDHYRLGDEKSGNLIIERMKEKKLTLKGLSEKVGVAEETLRRFLRILPLRKQLQLAQVLASSGEKVKEEVKVNSNALADRLRFELIKSSGYPYGAKVEVEVEGEAKVEEEGERGEGGGGVVKGIGRGGEWVEANVNLKGSYTSEQVRKVLEEMAGRLSPPLEQQMTFQVANQLGLRTCYDYATGSQKSLGGRQVVKLAAATLTLLGREATENLLENLNPTRHPDAKPPKESRAHRPPGLRYTPVEDVFIPIIAHWLNGSINVREHEVEGRRRIDLTVEIDFTVEGGKPHSPKKPSQHCTDHPPKTQPCSSS